MRSLDEIRASIDALDEQILQLLSARARCAQEVAEVKGKDSPDKLVQFYRPEREAQVLRRVMALNPGPLPAEQVGRLFREIMSTCLALEQPMRIAFLGPEGTYTHAAAFKHFGGAVTTVPLSSIDEVFREVEAGAAHYGVVPVENSTEGMVNHTLDSFMNSSLCMMGEVELRIHHHLLIAEGTQVGSISRIYSHQQSLAQCRKWLDAHFPKAERVAVSSNAEAARRVRGEWHSAAIAGETAGRLYDLVSLHANIEDDPNNTTRFLVIGADRPLSTGQDKTSILVSVHNQSGALYKVLEPFNRAGISLTRIETRPSRTDLWSYVFFIDFEGHQEDAPVVAVLDELRSHAAELKILGSYPKAIL